MRHVLALKAVFGKEGFRLLYLWYDAFREEGAAHRKEVDEFSETARSDGIKFHSLTCQKLIVSMCKACRGGHGSPQPPSLGCPIHSVAVKACAFGQPSNLTQSARAAQRISENFALRVSCLGAAHCRWIGTVIERLNPFQRIGKKRDLFGSRKGARRGGRGANTPTGKGSVKLAAGAVFYEDYDRE